MSGALFVLIVEPLLLGLEAEVTDQVARLAVAPPPLFLACADDFGASMLLRLHLVATLKIFRSFEAASAMALKICKW